MDVKKTKHCVYMRQQYCCRISLSGGTLITEARATGACAERRVGSPHLYSIMMIVVRSRTYLLRKLKFDIFTIHVYVPLRLRGV